MVEAVNDFSLQHVCGKTLVCIPGECEDICVGDLGGKSESDDSKKWAKDFRFL